MTYERGRDGAVVLGLVAPSGMPRELADQIAEELPGELGSRLGDVNWQVQVAGAERADTTPTSEALKQAVRRRMQDEGWDLHGLWERASGEDDRQSVVLFNLATTVTLGLAVLTLYAGLLVLSVLSGAALIPQSVYDSNVGHAPALADYLKLGWLAATIATLAGALGSLIESDESVREAAYRHHADTRTEGDDER